MDRRQFLIFGGGVLVGALLPVAFTGCSGEKNELTFKRLYPVPFFKSKYFQVVVTVGTIVAAAAVSYLSAGAGAPAAASGVSTIASWIGGGGPGSYMIGLSRIGSLVGGNAMTGAAILNGISIGTIGGTAGKASLLMAGKIAELLDVGLNGIAYYYNLKDSLKGIYSFRIPIPEGIGDERIQQFAMGVAETEKQLFQQITGGGSEKEKRRLAEELKFKYMVGEKVLEEELQKKSPSLGNLLLLGIIAYKSLNIPLFGKALAKIEQCYYDNLTRRSFLDYLWGLYYLSSPNKSEREKGLSYFYISHSQEKYAVEPVLGIVSILGEEYWKNRGKIQRVVEETAEEYDPSNYTGKSIFNLYIRAANIAIANRAWEDAAKYYLSALDEVGLLEELLAKIGINKQVGKLEKVLNLQIALSYKKLGNFSKARNFLEKALDRATGEEKRELQNIFNKG